MKALPVTQKLSVWGGLAWLFYPLFQRQQVEMELYISKKIPLTDCSLFFVVLKEPPDKVKRGNCS